MCNKAKLKALLCNRRAWTKSLSYGVLTILGVALFSSQLSIVVSETNSHPAHYFLHVKHLKPRLNDYTLSYSTWLGKKMVKQIIGIEGDFVWVNQLDEVFINDRLVGFAHPCGSDARALSPVPMQTIPEGFVFLYSPHRGSFDSRYQQLGLVPVSKLEGRAFPLW